MQPRDGSISFDPLAASGDGAEGESDPAEGPAPDAIRERQRRRRNVGRSRADLTAVLNRPDEADEDEEEADEPAAPAGPPPARVFVVFRGVSWEDPQGGLRESDSIVGVYASEEAARHAVALLEQEGGAAAESWYQPYAVQE